MKLVFSKSRFIGRIYAFSIECILLILLGFVLFDILSASPSSDFLNNINSIVGASEGSYWSGDNIIENQFRTSFEFHYYFWLGVLDSFFEDKATLLRVLTLFATFMLTYPILSSASQLRNKSLLFILLCVLFVHPRFLDLVISNIRSASALVFVFYSLRVNGTRLKFLLMGVGASFHLGVIAIIFLYLIYLFGRRLPESRSHSGLLVWP